MAEDTEIAQVNRSYPDKVMDLAEKLERCLARWCRWPK